MARRLFAMAILLLAPAIAEAQQAAGPLYSLPDDGVWVEYDWQQSATPGRELTGTLRISSVGKKEVAGQPHRWIEIKLQVRRGERTKRELRKLLVAEKALQLGRPLLECVVACYDQDAVSGGVTVLSGKRTNDFLSMGIRGDGARLREMRPRDDVLTALGAFTTRKVAARGTLDNRVLHYRGWLTDQVPFGWAKFEVEQTTGADAARVVLSAAAVKRGVGAKAEVDVGSDRTPR